VPLVVEQVLKQLATEYKLAETERALQESEAFTQAIISNSPIGVSVRSRTSQLISANVAWKKIWAIPDSDVQKDISRDRKMLDFDMWNDYLLPHLDEIRHIYEEGGYLHLPELKTTHPRPSAAEWVSQHFYAINNEQGQVERVVILTEDITERKQAEDATQTALQDKEVLLRELYHRTKNNMQVISSMLNLEMDRVEDNNAQKILQDMDNRIRSMALVHQKLYQSQNLSSLDLKEYIADLVNLLLESYQAFPGQINFSMQAESIPVLINTAIPCELIINEILSNSLKYVFPGERKGNIHVHLEQAKDATIILEISDDGICVPPERNLRQSNTLGMQTIFGIAGHQLNAIVDFKTDPGVTWHIQFSNNLYTSRV